MSQYGPDLSFQGHVWSTSDYFYFYFLKGVQFLPSFCFVCVAGGLCVCVVEYLCVVDSLSDVCVQKVLSTHAKRRLPHINIRPHTQNPSTTHTKIDSPKNYFFKKRRCLVCSQTLVAPSWPSRLMTSRVPIPILVKIW